VKRPYKLGCRALVIALVVASCAASVRAQQEPRLMNRGLAFTIADAATTEASGLRLSLPPSAEPLLAAIVVPGQTGPRMLDRMPAGSFEASNVWESPVPLQNEFTAPSDSPLIKGFLSGVGELREPYVTKFEASNITLRRLTPDSIPKAKAFILKSRAAIEAARAKSPILLVSAAYEGRVAVTFELQDSIAENAAPISELFTLSRPRPTVGILELTSVKPVEFAYHFDVIDLRLDADGNASSVDILPAKSTTTLPYCAWEGTETMIGSAAPEDFYRVKVFYATDRNLAPPTPAQKTKTWWVFFVSYFLSPYPWVVMLVVGGLSFAGWWFGTSKLGWWWLQLMAAIILTLGVPALLASIYARQQTEQPGAIVKGPVSAHRGELTYGTCNVSIPKNHKIGQLPRPLSLFLIDLEPEDPTKTISVLSRDPATDSKFFQLLEERMKESPQGECFVFVHGYNNTFDNAAQRTAQLWYDLQFQGAPIFFSWPSRGATAGYTFDETEATWAQTHFETFLKSLRAEESIKRIHIIAHSMGNRIVTGALGNLAATGDLKSQDCKFREVVLAAADIDADTFKTGIAPRFINQSPHVTFYASANDGALRYSYSVHDYRRAGDATGGVMVLRGMDSIDASLLDTSFENHSYFAAQRSVVSDIELMLRNGLPPGNRGLREAGTGDSKHWVFRP